MEQSPLVLPADYELNTALQILEVWHRVLQNQGAAQEIQDMQIRLWRAVSRARDALAIAEILKNLPVECRQPVETKSQMEEVSNTNGNRMICRLADELRVATRLAQRVHSPKTLQVLWPAMLRAMEGVFRATEHSIYWGSRLSCQTVILAVQVLEAAIVQRSVERALPCFVPPSARRELLILIVTIPYLLLEEQGPEMARLIAALDRPDVRALFGIDD